MREDTVQAPVADPDLAVSEITGGFFRRSVLKLLASLRECRITVIEGAERMEFGQPSGDDVLRVTMRVNDADLYRQASLNGSVGVAESYMLGQWDCDDLVGLVRIFVRNRDVLDDMERGLARLGAWLLKRWHALRRNTREGSRRNIAAHYDLGNELFKLFLDPTLMYSSAVYARPDEALEVAAVRKLDRICQKLDLQPGEHLVEIGTGWGGFAIHAASRFDVRVTTTTISREQYELAQQRIAAAGLAHKVEVVLSDYRDLQGQYDKLVSIEMIEAIGHQYLDTYFAKLGSLLKPEGLALVQAITIEDHRYQQALREVDFIKRHIFPGSFIPAVSAMVSSAARSSDLRLVNLEDIGPSYALTLHAWRERFAARYQEVRALGYDEAFVRMWHWYLAYCEGGFIERSIGDVQMLLARPRNRRNQFLPDLAPTV